MTGSAATARTSSNGKLPPIKAATATVSWRKHQYPRAKRDYYAEPEWATALLLDAIGASLLWPGAEVWDPCCGGGNIIRVARSRGFKAWGTDIERRGAGGCADFLRITLPPSSVANIIFNPPYGRGRWVQFVERARHITSNVVAAFLPLASLASERRFDFYERGGLKRLVVLSSRPSPGPGEMLANGTLEADGGMVDYGWFVWQRGHVGPPTILWARRR